MIDVHVCKDYRIFSELLNLKIELNSQRIKRKSLSCGNDGINCAYVSSNGERVHGAPCNI